MRLDERNMIALELLSKGRWSFRSYSQKVDDLGHIGLTSKVSADDPGPKDKIQSASFRHEQYPRFFCEALFTLGAERLRGGGATEPLAYVRRWKKKHAGEVNVHGI